MKEVKCTPNRWKTTDKLIEFPLYDENGYLNRGFVTKQLIALASISFILFNIIFLFLLFIKDSEMSYLNIFNIEFFKYFFESLKYYIINNFTISVDKDFTISLLLSSILSYFITSIAFSEIRELANTQRNMSSMKLSQYYLLNHDRTKKQYTFKLKKGEMSRYDFFVDKNEDFKQLFKLKKINVERFGDDKVIVHYSEALPDIKTFPKNIDFTKDTGSDKYYLGISDTEGTPIYSAPKEQGKGLLNGNWLIVGGSGSGKSFALKEMIQNILLPENYKFVDKIYIINYKGSADYNFLRGLDKFEYADDIPTGMKLLKKVLLDMKAKYKWNSKNSEDNFLAYQTIIIIDEVQTLNEALEAKSLHKIMKATIQESLSILETLGSKIRASNGSLINVLQKADVNSLPSTAYRSNMRNRYMLKQENVSSAHLVVNSDTTSEMGVNPLRLMQGQFLYWDMLTNQLSNGFVVLTGNDANNEELNKLPMDLDAQKVLDEVNSLKRVAIEDLEKEKEHLEKLEEDGKKTFSDDFVLEEPVEEEYEEETDASSSQALKSVSVIKAPVEVIKEPSEQRVALVQEEKVDSKNSELDLFNSL